MNKDRVLQTEQMERIWDIESETVIVSRDVTFDENSKDTSSFFPTITVHYRNDVDFLEREVKEEFESNIDFTGMNQEIEIKGSSDIDLDSSDTNDRISPPFDDPNKYGSRKNQENIDFWKLGIDREHECITRNKTWKLVKRESCMHVLPYKYVFRIKEGKHKVLIVALGCRQIHVINYSRKQSPRRW